MLAVPPGATVLGMSRVSAPVCNFVPDLNLTSVELLSQVVSLVFFTIHVVANDDPVWIRVSSVGN